jgi:hypothetical protein
MAWCLVKAQGELYLYLYTFYETLIQPVEEENICPFRESKPCCSARSLVSILTELSRLLRLQNETIQGTLGETIERLSTPREFLNRHFCLILHT